MYSDLVHAAIETTWESHEAKLDLFAYGWVWNVCLEDVNRKLWVQVYKNITSPKLLV